jgi:protein TonB
MFEDATFHSSNVSPGQARKWMLFTFAVNLTLVATMIVPPLMYPDGLLPRPYIDVVYAPPATSHVRQAHPHAAIAPTQSSQPAISPLRVPQVVPIRPPTGSGDAPGNSVFMGSLDFGGSGDSPGAIPTAAFGPSSLLPLHVNAAQPSSVKLSVGVTEGLLLSKTAPAYPVIAKTTGISGTVVLAATISTSGSIQNLRVVSGSPMLRQAAIDAVKNWRYRPYLLNNQPVEVETTIDVIFSLGNRQGL